MEKQYEFKFSASAVGYILALLNKRPREESNEFYLAIERTIKEQDEQAEKGVAEAVHFLLQRMEKLEATTAQVQAQDGAKEACGQYDVTDAQTGRAQGTMTWGELRNQD